MHLMTAEHAYCTLRTPCGSKCCTKYIRSLQIKNTYFFFTVLDYVQEKQITIYYVLPPKKKKKRPSGKGPSSVEARGGACVVHADLVSPVGNAGLWILGGGEGLRVVVGRLQAGGRVAEVGGGPVVRGQAWLRRGLLGILQAGAVQVLGHSDCRPRTVEHCVALLLLLAGLLALLLVGLFDVTLVCTGKKQEQKGRAAD